MHMWTRSNSGVSRLSCAGAVLPLGVGSSEVLLSSSTSILFEWTDFQTSSHKRSRLSPGSSFSLSSLTLCFDPGGFIVVVCSCAHWRASKRQVCNSNLISMRRSGTDAWSHPWSECRTSSAPEQSLLAVTGAWLRTGRAKPSWRLQQVLTCVVQQRAGAEQNNPRETSAALFTGLQSSSCPPLGPRRRFFCPFTFDCLRWLNVWLYHKGQIWSRLDKQLLFLLEEEKEMEWNKWSESFWVQANARARPFCWA